MELTFTEDAIARLTRYTQQEPKPKIVLDFDDGVGEFSKVALCTMDMSFNLFFVPPTTPLTDHTEAITSNLGDVYIKPYSKMYLDEHLKVDLQPKFLNFTLSSPNGMLDEGLQVAAPFS